MLRKCFLLFLSGGENDTKKKHSLEKRDMAQGGSWHFSKGPGGAIGGVVEGKCCEQTVLALVWTETLRLFPRSRREGRRHSGACRPPGGQMDLTLLNPSWDGGRKGRASQPGHNRHFGPHNPLCPVGGLSASLASTQAHLLSVNLCQKW